MCIKICLDAGHYGKYNRSPGVPEYYESDMNWKLHLMLKEELEKHGFEVITTRENQATDLELTRRGRLSKGCDLFLSIHSNAVGSEMNETVDRPVGIYLVDDNCGGIDERSKEIARLLAGVVAQVMDTHQSAQTYSRLSGNDRDGDGKCNDDYYGVLYGAHQVGTPGVILEHSFHTNTRAAKWLLVEENLRALAVAEADALAAYFKDTALPEELQTCTVDIPMLRRGDKGGSVKALQTLLIAFGCSCGEHGVDGSFGPATDKALRDYQQEHGLAVDGICGPATWTSLLCEGV